MISKLSSQVRTLITCILINCVYSLVGILGDDASDYIVGDLAAGHAYPLFTTASLRGGADGPRTCVSELPPRYGSVQLHPRGKLLLYGVRNLDLHCLIYTIVR